jgi:hypothetical protein
MPDFLAWDPADWSALAAAVTTLVAVVAAAFAFLQVRQARLLREEQAQPFVVVDFEPSPVWSNIINLVIQNSGKTVAKDVLVVFDPPLVSSQPQEGYELAKSVLLTSGIPTMPPGKRIATMFDVSHERKDSFLPMTYTATVHFSDWRNKPQEPLTYVLDLNFLYGLTQVTEYGMHDAAKALREMRDTIKGWTAHSNGLLVHAVDEDARNFSDRWQREKSGRHPSMGNPTPAGRRAPSRFDRYREPIWRRIYWSVRLAQDRREQVRELETKISARPDLAPMLQNELERLRSRAWGRLRRRKGE